MAFVSNSAGMSVWFEQFFRGSWQGEYNSSQLAVFGDQMTQKNLLKAQGILLAAGDHAHLHRFAICSNVDQELRAVQKTACLQNNLITARCWLPACFYIIQAFLCSRCYNLKVLQKFYFKSLDNAFILILFFLLLRMTLLPPHAAIWCMWNMLMCITKNSKTLSQLYPWAD